MKRALLLVVAVLLVGGCGSSSGGGDTNPLPPYRPNSNQTGDPGY